MRVLNTRRVDCESFLGNVPFPHTVLDGLFLPDFCREVAGSFPHPSDSGWHTYDNPLERKMVYNDRYGEPEHVHALYDTLSDVGFLDLLEQITERPGLAWDGDLYAGGLCLSWRGGKLDIHRDANIHAIHGWKRELSCVLFLNDEWRPEWGGALEFWSERDGKPFQCEKVIEPRLGRFVIFDPDGFHGYPDPIQCPPDVTRKSVQCFYWSADKPRHERRRATFAARPGDPPDRELDRLRSERMTM